MRIFYSLLLVKEWRPVVFSSVLMGVVFIAPVMILMAVFCVLSSLLVLDFAAVDQADIPYSITGRIVPV